MQIITTSINKPPKIVIFGKPGTGKSRFAAGMPEPFFIRTEDRHAHLSVKADDHIVTEWADLVFNQLDWLLKEKHQFKTVVLDTADSAEKIVHAYVCQRAGTDNISDPKALAFHRGYKEAAMLWEKEILSRLTELNEQKKIMPVILSHVSTTYEMHPVYGDYPKFTMGVDASRNGLASKIYKWADLVMMLDWQTTTVGKEDQGTLRLRSTGQRVLRIAPRAGWDTKESYDLPESIDVPEDAPGELKGWSTLKTEIAKGIAKRHPVGNLAGANAAREAQKLTEPKGDKVQQGAPAANGQ